MRHYSIIALLVLLTSCAANHKGDCQFTIKIDKVGATKATVTIEPSDPSAYYISNFLSEEMDYYTWKDQDNVKFQLDFIQEMMQAAAEFSKTDIDFASFCCYQGQKEDKIYYLTPDTSYKIIVFQVDPQTRESVGTPVSVTFHTNTIEKSSITFQFKWEADKLTITPSNNDEYFWDFEEKDVILDEYPSVETYFLDLTFFYEDYDFMPAMTNRGQVEYVFSEEHPGIDEGDHCCLAIGGYSSESGEVTTDITTLEFIYHKDKPCELVQDKN